MDELEKALHALARKLQPNAIELIIGGGYGLVLRARHLAATQRTGRYGLPLNFRSTGDIDCFLSADIITDGEKTEKIATALRELGFTARVPHFIFERAVEIGGQQQILEVDLLAADVRPEHESFVRRSDNTRIRPRSYGQLHARLTPEAVTVESCTMTIVVGPEDSEVAVKVPHPISTILMKLFAFRDRIESRDPEKVEDAPYHAFDVFMVLASIDAAEWEQGRRILGEAAARTIVDQAREIIRKYFGDTYSVGTVRLVEYANEKEGIRIREESVVPFVRDLTDLFAL